MKVLAPGQATEAFTVAWTSTDDFAVKSHDVDVSIDGRAWARWLSGTTATPATYVGARGHAFAFRVRARDHKGNTSSWTGIPAAGGTPSIKVGGFARVVTDTLNARSAPGTAQPILTTLSTGRPDGHPPGPGERQRVHLVPRRGAADRVGRRRERPVRPVGGDGRRWRDLRRAGRAAQHHARRRRCHPRLHGRGRVVSDHPGPPARHAGRQRPVGHVPRRGGAHLPADRPRRRPGRCGRRDRQPDRDRRDRGRLRQHRSVDDQQADDLDAQRGEPARPSPTG